VQIIKINMCQRAIEAIMQATWKLNTPPNQKDKKKWGHLQMCYQKRGKRVTMYNACNTVSLIQVPFSYLFTYFYEFPEAVINCIAYFWYKVGNRRF
jgi:hypothetical protein